MSLSLKPQRLKRYRDIAGLILKYSRKKLLQYQRFDQLMDDERLKVQVADGVPEQLTQDLENLGPTFIKLGQMLSTRADLMSPPYLEALARLQDDVAPFPFHEVEAAISRELGVRVGKVFREFDPTPIAAASLGQVHRAQLQDGREVAVKVQRPNIRQTILDDFESLRDIISTIDYYTNIGRQFSISEILDNFHKTLLRELDFRQEAENQITLGEYLQDYPQILIPQSVPELTSSRILTMEFIRGQKPTQLTPLSRLELHTEHLAEKLFSAYLDQVLVHGFFHADPHPGNILITPDGRLALLDLGMVATLDGQLQENLLKLLFAIHEGRGQDVAKCCAAMGNPTDQFDEKRFTKGVVEVIGFYQKSKSRRPPEGRVVLELTRLSAECNLRPAAELAVLGKALLNLDDVTRLLHPDFDSTKVMQHHSEQIMRQRMLKTLSPTSVLSTLMETQRLTRQLPDRLNTLLDSLVRQQFELKINAIDEVRLIDSLHKIANRIALGLVLAALIIGAAMMMQVESTHTLWGYPAFGIIMFLGAAGCGFYLVFSVLLGDRPKRPRR